MTKEIKYVRSRGKDSILTYRRDYPGPLKPILGTTYQRTLGTSNWEEAVEPAAVCNLEYARNVARAKAELVEKTQKERKNYDNKIADDWIQIKATEWLYSEVIEEDFGAPDEVTKFKNLAEAKENLKSFAAIHAIHEDLVEAFVQVGLGEYLHAVAVNKSSAPPHPQEFRPFLEDPVRRKADVKVEPATLKGLLNKWVERPDLDEVRTREVKNAVRDFLAIHEIPDIEVGAITYEMIDVFFKEITARPARSGIRQAWRDLPHPEMMSKFRKTVGIREYDRIKTPTVTKIGNAISSMLNDALRKGRIDRNPFHGNVPRISKRERVKTKYDKFSEDDARKLFRAPLWTGHSPIHPNTRGSVIVLDGRYWIFPILAWSGMRLGEVSQLRRDNIKEESGIRYFDVVAKHAHQSLKEVSSERRVPIHNELIEAGFWDHVEACDPNGWLFPELSHDQGPTARTSNISQFYGRIIPKTLPDTQLHLVSHSWRHTFKSYLRRLGCDEKTENFYAIMGHDDGRVGASYGDFPIEPLQDVVQRVQVLGASLAHLKEARSKPGIKVIKVRKTKGGSLKRRDNVAR